MGHAVIINKLKKKKTHTHRMVIARLESAKYLQTRTRTFDLNAYSHWMQE
jgi:hypothetical protein